MEADNVNNDYSDYNNYNYSCSSDLPCKKHPSSSNVGICAQCLKDRLIKLVCSDCGEQRLSSCSCSDISSSYRNSSCTMEVGSVGRISFLIENDKTEPTHSNSSKPLSKKGEGQAAEEVILLKRSNSCCVEAKKSQGLWRIGKFFKKKMKGTPSCDYMDVSRSRSLCSVRGSVGNFTDQEESEFAYSSAKISDVNDSEPRKSGVKKGNNGLMEVESASNKSAFPLKESDFRRMDESGFIDLKLDLSTMESKTEYSAFKKSDSPLSVSDFAMFRGEKFLEHIENEGSFGSERGFGVFGNGGSCRITVNDRGIKKGGKGHKVWKWMFKSHPGWRSSSRKKDVNEFLKT